MKPAPALTLRQLSWCFALALSLLFTQFAGQRHRIDHTLWASAQQAGSGAKASWTGATWTEATHSCIALDAATLADSVCANAVFFAPAALGATLWLSAVLPRDLPFTAHFRSRAPPRLP